MKIEVERLKKLATFLKRVPPEKFDLESWVSGDVPTQPDCSCDTVACAVGWATVIFAQEGFKYDDIMMRPVFGKTRSWRAVQKFFGLTQIQAEHLFMVHAYFDDVTGDDLPQSPLDVAVRILDFVEEHESKKVAGND